MKANYWSFASCEWMYYGEFENQESLNSELDEKGYNKRYFMLEQEPLAQQPMKVSE